MTTTTIIDDRTIEECGSCGSQFGGLSPSDGASIVLAKCSSCERRYYVSTLTEPSPGLSLGDEATSGFLPSRHLSGQRATSIKDVLAQDPALKNIERRQQPRYRAHGSLVAVPLDGEFQPTASACVATGIDISSIGIAFSVQNCPEASFWAVDLRPTLGYSLQSMMKIVRMEPLGQDTWKVAGPFVTDEEMSSWSQ